MKKTARRFAAPSNTAQSRLTASSAGMQMQRKRQVLRTARRNAVF